MQTRKPLALAFALLLAQGCGKDKPSLQDMSKEVEQKEAKIRQEREAAASRDKAELDALLPRLAEKRKAMDAAFGAIWSALPDPKNMKRKECPDPKITADTPDESRRAVLLVNKELVNVLAGKARPAPDGGAEEIHTPAAYHAFAFRRAEGPETPITEVAPPANAEQAKARLDAIDFVMAHRYLGVILITQYKEADATGARPSPARVEGWTVVFDREGARPLCQIEGSGESVAQKDSVSTGNLSDEEAFRMYLYTTAKNIDAISKALWVEGAPRKKR